MLVRELKERVAREEYAVDCRAVAEAILSRQARCSNPLSLASPWGPLNVTPAGWPGPRFTRPTTKPDSPAGPDASSS
jgi:hypothetical protein